MDNMSEFIQRHIGPSESEQRKMLADLGLSTIEELVREVVPTSILLRGDSKLIKDWYITNVDYCHLLGDKEKTFVYLDPPYDIKDNLYGKKGSMHKKFNHDNFAESCEIYNSDMLISYNSDQLVKDRFKDWNCAEFDLTYTMRSVGEYMRNQKTRKELLLFNYNTGVF